MNKWGEFYWIRVSVLGLFAVTSASAAVNIVSVSFTADLPEAVTADEIAIYDQFDWDTNTVATGTFTLSDEPAVSSDGGLVVYNSTVFTGGTFAIGEEAFEFGEANGVFILDTNNESQFDLDLSSMNPLSGSDLAIGSANFNLTGAPGALTEVSIAGLIEAINYYRLTPYVLSADFSWNDIFVDNLNLEHIYYQASEVPEPGTFTMLLGLVAAGFVASVRKPFLNAVVR